MSEITGAIGANPEGADSAGNKDEWVDGVVARLCAEGYADEISGLNSLGRKEPMPICPSVWAIDGIIPDEEANRVAMNLLMYCGEAVL